MIEIRAEEKADHSRVFEIQAAAFGRRNEANLVEILRASADPYLSLVAAEGERILGHIFFSPVAIEAPRRAPRASGLAPVAVDPDHQRVGIGFALIRAGLERCRVLGWKAVFLVGDPGYYSRLGFALASPLGFSYGSPLFDAALQVRELNAGALTKIRGRVRFHPAFARTGCG